MSAVLAIAAMRPAEWTLAGFLILLALNQFWAGLVSPRWFDLVTRTIRPEERGRLLGWRSATGALLAFLNSCPLTALLGSLGFS